MSAAAIAAGCGSSSSSSTSTSAPTSAPATASTPATTTVTGAIDPHHVPKSAVIASSAYYNALVQGFSARLNPTQAQFAAHCVQSGLEAAGFKTQGDSEGANANKSISIVIPCLQKARTQ